VKNGTVQKKHRWDYYAKEYAVREGDGEIPIVREPAFRGCRHLVTEDDLRTFLTIIPDWARYSTGLRGLVLGDGDDDCYGWHDVGVICIHAWSSEIEETWPSAFFEEHKPVLDRLLAPHELDDRANEFHCEFTKKTAAGFLLMHVFLHELGHHYDRMQTKARTHSGRGESFAESFGNELAEDIWNDFFRTFGF
jgi:hypothetical protein